MIVKVIIPIGEDELEVTWDAVPGAVEYKIYALYEPGESFKRCRTVSTNSYYRELKTWYLPGYCLKVSAVDEEGRETQAIEAKYSWRGDLPPVSKEVISALSVINSFLLDE
jgi:hypothetical protein